MYLKKIHNYLPGYRTPSYPIALLLHWNPTLRIRFLRKFYLQENLISKLDFFLRTESKMSSKILMWVDV